MRSNFSWTLVSNIIYAGCQWGVLAAIAKLGTPEMVGEFALALAITVPIQAFFQMQLRGVQATDARRDFDDGEYFSFRAISTVVAIIFSLLVVIALGYSVGVSLVIVVMTLGKACDSIADVFYGGFQQRERMDIIAKGMIINGVGSFLFAVAGVWYADSLLAGTIGYAMGSLLPLLVYVIPKVRNLNDGQGLPIRWWAWSHKRGLVLLRLAFPLGIAILLLTVTANVSRYVIDYFYGAGELGIYAAISYLLVAGTTVVNALGQAVSPRLAAYYSSGDYKAFVRMLVRMSSGVLGLGLVGFLVSLAFGRKVLSILYTPSYAERVDVLAVLALGAGVMFASSILGYGLTAARKFSVQVPIVLIILVANIVVSLLLVPPFGLMGAAIGAGLVQLLTIAAFWFALARALESGEKDHGYAGEN